MAVAPPANSDSTALAAAAYQSLSTNTFQASDPASVLPVGSE